MLFLTCAMLCLVPIVLYLFFLFVEKVFDRKTAKRVLGIVLIVGIGAVCIKLVPKIAELIQLSKTDPDAAYSYLYQKSTGRIGFEKEGETYALFIDKGITCSRNNAPALFLEWLSNGTLRFLDFTDMKEFLRSLRCLY